MEPEEFRSLEQLKTAGNYNYRIKVMVSRKWNGSFYNKHGWNGIHMLILDNKSCRMHCVVPSTLRTDLSEDLIEGAAYEFTNIMVSTYKGKYKCCDDEFHIVLSDETIIRPLYNYHDITPKEIFKFTDICTLEKSSFQDDHCLDVIGFVSDKESLDMFVRENSEEEPYLDFVMTDNLYKVKVRFTGEFAIACNSSFTKNSTSNKHNTIVALSSCKMVLNRLTNETYLSNAPSTKFFINDDIPQEILSYTRSYKLLRGKNQKGSTSIG
ncbi:hypothetical protein ACET3Z_008997 [Daucus carota]